MTRDSRPSAQSVEARESLPVVDSGGNWKFLCPECHERAYVTDSYLYCPSEGRWWAIEDDIYPLLSEYRRCAKAPFIRVYGQVRREEGWAGDAQYYLDLPFRDRSRRHAGIWKIRARSFRQALDEIERHFGDARLRVLELGAGNCWLSSRLARSGHHVLATDIFLDARDGLAAFEIYRHQTKVGLDRALADMEELPLAEDQFDLVVASGSIHYAHLLRLAVTEAHRVLRRNGLFLVLDSPTYRSPDHGKAMVNRRIDEHRERYGIATPSGDQTGFLVLPDFVELLERSGFTVRQRRTFDGSRRSLRRWISPWMGWNPPAEFMIFSARKN